MIHVHTIPKYSNIFQSFDQQPELNDPTKQHTNISPRLGAVEEDDKKRIKLSISKFSEHVLHVLINSNTMKR